MSTGLGTVNFKTVKIFKDLFPKNKCLFLKKCWFNTSRSSRVFQSTELWKFTLNFHDIFNSIDWSIIFKNSSLFIFIGKTKLPWDLLKAATMGSYVNLHKVNLHFYSIYLLTEWIWHLWNTLSCARYYINTREKHLHSSFISVMHPTKWITYLLVIAIKISAMGWFWEIMSYFVIKIALKWHYLHILIQNTVLGWFI